MKITILNGSPKGEQSVTLQYIHFLQKKYPQHHYKIWHISQRIKQLERDHNIFSEVLADVKAADLILWATPVYYLLVPGQYKRFIELVTERSGIDSFAGHYAAALTTSIHFFDHTANSYLAGICEDWGMRFYGSYSAEMMDLMKPEGQDRLRQFADGLFAAIDGGEPTLSNHEPLVPHSFVYTPGSSTIEVDQDRFKVLVVMDGADRSPNLSRMIERIQFSYKRPVDIVDLNNVHFKGGCQGCLHCGFDNECVYEGKDEFIEMFRNKVMTADILFFAGAIRDRYFSANWKIFFDRSFFRGHAPSLIGKQVVWIVAGPLRQIQNLRQIMEAYTEIQKANLAGIISDEYADSTQIDRLLDSLVSQTTAWAANGYVKPDSFLSVGGRKLFRDEIWGNLRFVFQADHKSYRKLGFYDFPQRKLGTRALNFFAPLLQLPFLRKQFVKRLKSGMINPFQRVLEE